MSSTKKITLRSSDGEVLEVEEAVAFQSETIRPLVEKADADSVIPLPTITGEILSKVVEYCKRHVDAAAPDEDLKNFDADFVKVDNDTLFGVIRAADYLKIQTLLDLTCQTLADMIKGKTPDEIRKIFNFSDNLTPEEEEEIRRENAWAFE